MPRKLTTDIFVARASFLHNNKYDYGLVTYSTAKTKIPIICPEHGTFWQTPDKHLQGQGCPLCASTRKKSQEQFLKDAQKVHGDRYDYSITRYVNDRSFVNIICPKHGVFRQRANDHLHGKGCLKCRVFHIHDTKKLNGSYRKSTEEENLYLKLITVFSKKDIFRQYIDLNRYPFACDFYIKSLDLFIELNAFWTHGGHWFDKHSKSDLKQVHAWRNHNTAFYDNAIETWTKRDVIKRKSAKENNLNYVVLWNKQDIEDWFSQGSPVRYDWK